MIDGKAAVIIAGTLAGASICWAIAFAWAKWLTRPRPATQLPADVDQRLRQIEQAVDTVAIEVERLGEGQRFTTRLLGEQAQKERSIVRPAGEYRPVDTPH